MYGIFNFYNKLKILFRTSGGKAKTKELGFGHVYRCINLANHFKKKFSFFLIEDYGNVKKTLNQFGYNNISLLKNNASLQRDVNQTIRLVNQKKIDVIVVDKYNTKISYLKTINKFAKVVFVSDLLKIDYPADLLVNGFLGFKNKVFKNKYGTKCLLGPSYQILDIRFSKKKNKGKDKFSLLATFGGFDEHNLVETFCYSLSNHISKLRIKIILGPATKKSKKIKELEKKYPKNLTIISSTNDMSKEISQSTFGICSGGITSYEFASLKKPFAIICQYPHQIKTAQEWEKKGFAFNLGLPNKNILKRIEKFLKMIIEKNVRYSPMNIILDGKGTKRVALEIIKLLQKN